MDSTIFVLGRDSVGTVAEDRSMTPAFRYYLTECCGASAKGSGNSPTGACCRACYTPIDSALGGTPGCELRRYAHDWKVVLTDVDLVETYGDGIPYETWKAARSS